MKTILKVLKRWDIRFMTWLLKPLYEFDKNETDSWVE